MPRHPVAKLCIVHKRGVSLDMPKFFYDGCWRCEEKLAAGKVAREDGPLPRNWRLVSKRVRPHVDWEKKRIGEAAAKKRNAAAVRAHLFVGRDS